jgi:hypothetical protein
LKWCSSAADGVLRPRTAAWLDVIAASRIGYDGTGFAQMISLDAGRVCVFCRITASVDSCSISVEVFNISAALGEHSQL